MSLINDALKKAQRERDEIARSAPPPPPRSDQGEPPPPPPAPRRSPWIFVLAAAVIAAGSTWLTVRLTRPDPVVAPVVAAAPTPPPAASSPISAAPVASLPAPLPTLAPTPSPAPTPLMTISPTAEVARIQGVIDRLTIAAVRISESGNRALVNDRLLRVNDALEGLSGVRVKSIEVDHIDFVDRFGNIYTKRR